MMKILSDTCPQGWISNDNSCYKLETPLSKRSGPRGAQEYCMNEYKAFAVVPNSVGEATYLKSYLSEIKVVHEHNKTICRVLDTSYIAGISGVLKEQSLLWNRGRHCGRARTLPEMDGWLNAQRRRTH